MGRVRVMTTALRPVATTPSVALPPAAGVLLRFYLFPEFPSSAVATFPWL